MNVIIYIFRDIHSGKSTFKKRIVCHVFKVSSMNQTPPYICFLLCVWLFSFINTKITGSNRWKGWLEVTAGHLSKVTELVRDTSGAWTQVVCLQVYPLSYHAFSSFQSASVCGYWNPGIGSSNIAFLSSLVQTDCILMPVSRGCTVTAETLTG